VGGGKRKYMAIQKLHEIKELHETIFCLKDKKNVYLPSLRMEVPDHVYVFGSLLLQ
jgi:hypothetical protein